MRSLWGVFTVCLPLLAGPLIADEPKPAAIGDALKELNTFVLDHSDDAKHRRWKYMWPDDADARLRAINRNSTAAWNRLRSRADWEAFRDLRIAALRASLGTHTPDVAPVGDGDNARVHVTGEVPGVGFVVRKLVFTSAPGVVVTANLYAPDPPRESMPAVLVAHSHHTPKHDNELQNLGANLSRAGCLVLVPDLLCHGERRQHPFARDADYRAPFRLTRQDYYFRYNVGMQLQLVGESLMGWIVRDMRRCVDVLLGQPGVDRSRVIMLGAVAGGGDVAAVTAALDDRVTAAVPFNFGGPEPESPYPLPEDAEETFDYAGGGSWESTRNLRRSAVDGFLPWVIVGSIAPRHVVHAHEFAWDADHDPVWKRYQRIWSWHDASDRLASLQGFGVLRRRAPRASHCTHIGPPHRAALYPTLKRWFGIPEPDVEYRTPVAPSQLECMTPELAERLDSRTVQQLVAAKADTLLSAITERRAFDRNAADGHVRDGWRRALGSVKPVAPATSESATSEPLPRATLHRLALRIERNVVVPMLLFVPTRDDGVKPPVVMGLAQEGKQWFMQLRREGVAALLERGVAVCLPDLRGTGETYPGPADYRGRRSWDSAVSASELMLGDPTLAARLRDTFAVLGHLRGRDDVDAGRVAFWAENFAPTNRPNMVIRMPLAISQLPYQAEPLGGIVALLAAMFDDDIDAVYVRRGLIGYRSILDRQFVYTPHDLVVPGALFAGDLRDVAAALAPRPVWMQQMITGTSQPTEIEAMREVYSPAVDAYKQRDVADALRIDDAESSPAEVARWLAERLK